MLIPKQDIERWKLTKQILLPHKGRNQRSPRKMLAIDHPQLLILRDDQSRCLPSLRKDWLQYLCQSIQNTPAYRAGINIPSPREDTRPPRQSRRGGQKG